MTSENFSIVVEGESDAQLLRKILEPVLPRGTRFFAARGRGMVPSLARNILAHESSSVLAVLDADTAGPGPASVERGMLLAALHSVAPPYRSDVFLFLPTLSIVFFEASDLLPREHANSSLAQFAPDKILLGYLSEQGFKSVPSWLESMKGEDLQKIRSGLQVQALIEAIRHLTAVESQWRVQVG